MKTISLKSDDLLSAYKHVLLAQVKLRALFDAQPAGIGQDIANELAAVVAGASLQIQNRIEQLEIIEDGLIVG
jgi:hypothetical protein